MPPTPLPILNAIFHTPDPQGIDLAAGILALLLLASAIGFVLAKTAKTPKSKATVANLNARTKSWWLMAALFGLALYFRPLGPVLLFALLSFLSLRELLTLTPTRRGDHHTLFWVFFVSVPLQYLLIYRNWYGLFSILLPVYGFLFIAVRTATAGDTKRYLERVAKTSLAMTISVYFLSHAAALLTLPIPGYESQTWKLLAYLVIVAQLSDVLQYVCGKLAGRTQVAPTLSPNKTLEGLLGGALLASLLGAALYPITPFTFWQSLGMSLTITLWGFFGGLVMSAIKRDAGVKDFGTLLEGHGGITDRIDSLAFAAPVFFHLTRYFFVPG